MEKITQSRALALALFISLLQKPASASSSSATMAVPSTVANIDGDLAYRTVESCDSTKVSTYTRKLTHEWTINDPTKYECFNRSLYDDGNHRAINNAISMFTFDYEYGGNWNLELSMPGKLIMDVAFNATFHPDRDDEDIPNVVMGKAVVRYGNVTLLLSCFDAYPKAINPVRRIGLCCKYSGNSV